MAEAGRELETGSQPGGRGEQRPECGVTSQLQQALLPHPKFPTGVLRVESQGPFGALGMLLPLLILAVPGQVRPGSQLSCRQALTLPPTMGSSIPGAYCSPAY